MTTQENTLINLIREHEDPAEALKVASEIIAAHVAQLESSAAPSPAVREEFS